MRAAGRVLSSNAVNNRIKSQLHEETYVETIYNRLTLLCLLRA
ncbi:hypothetical protein DIKCMJMK_04073 [Shewanella oneidensis]|nr:hypothetical protein [Shewanella oneidensis]